MAKNIKSIAEKMGAQVICETPEFGGGSFGAARLAQFLHGKLKPAIGKRPGRPTNANWVKRPKVPMSEETLSLLAEYSRELSSEGRKISPMQLAAEIIEAGVHEIQRQHRSRS